MTHQIDLRIVGIGSTGAPLMLFPAFSLPGWITWERAISRLKGCIVTFELLATKWALEDYEPAEPYRLKLETETISASLRSAQIRQPFDVVGHSAGGTIALDFALDYPAAIRSLTLIEPGPLWVLERTGNLDTELIANIEKRKMYYSKSISSADYAEFLRWTMGGGYEPHASPHWSDLCRYRANMRFRTALYSHRDDPSRIRDAVFPVLLIMGSQSDRYHRKIVEVLQLLFKNAKTVEMPGGHAPHTLGGLDVFLDVLAAFRQR